MLNCSAVADGFGEEDEDDDDSLFDELVDDGGNARGGPHTYINCDPILSFLGACES